MKNESFSFFLITAIKSNTHIAIVVIYNSEKTFIKISFTNLKILIINLLRINKNKTIIKLSCNIMIATIKNHNNNKVQICVANRREVYKI